MVAPVIIAAGISAASALASSQAQAGAQKAQAGLDREAREQLLRLLMGGFTSPAGTTGPGGTDLSFTEQKKFDEAQRLQTGAGRTSANLFDAASRFDPTSSVLPTGFSRADARGIVTGDNALKNTILDQVLNRAFSAEQRRAGGTSNFGSPTGTLGRTIGDLRSASSIGGEQAARDIFQGETTNFLNNTVTAGGQAGTTALAPNQSTDLGSFNQDTVRAASVLSGAGAGSANPPNPAVSSALGGAASIFGAIGANNQNERLIALLNRQVGNQSGQFNDTNPGTFDAAAPFDDF